MKNSFWSIAKLASTELAFAAQGATEIGENVIRRFPDSNSIVTYSSEITLVSQLMTHCLLPALLVNREAKHSTPIDGLLSQIQTAENELIPFAAISKATKLSGELARLKSELESSRGCISPFFPASAYLSYVAVGLTLTISYLVALNAEDSAAREAIESNSTYNWCLNLAIGLACFTHMYTYYHLLQRHIHTEATNKHCKDAITLVKDELASEITKYVDNPVARLGVALSSDEPDVDEIQAIMDKCVDLYENEIRTIDKSLVGAIEETRSSVKEHHSAIVEQVKKIVKGMPAEGDMKYGRLQEYSDTHITNLKSTVEDRNSAYCREFNTYISQVEVLIGIIASQAKLDIDIGVINASDEVKSAISKIDYNHGILGSIYSQRDALLKKLKLFSRWVPEIDDIKLPDTLTILGPLSKCKMSIFHQSSVSNERQSSDSKINCTIAESTSFDDSDDDKEDKTLSINSH